MHFLHNIIYFLFKYAVMAHRQKSSPRELIILAHATSVRYITKIIGKHIQGNIYIYSSNTDS